MSVLAKQKTILIVDDVELNRAILCELFQHTYAILEAENGEEALRVIKQHQEELSIVLLDVVMPVMDGIEVLRRLQGNAALERIPVILITAESSESTALKGYNLGVADIVNKPFNPEIVSRRVENVMELYEHKRHLESKLQEQYAALEEQAKKLARTSAFVIDTLSTVVEFRNGESGSHIRRIRQITRVLLEALSAQYEEYRFTDAQISLITDASALHDIGKIAIPDSVLLKPGKLTEKEFEVMKSHTIKGCEILQRLDLGHLQNDEFYQYCYEICRHHHERWDGRGYPDGLQGSEITIWAQVVSLADVYEALTNERVYKPPYTHSSAVSMILNGECGSFNPQLLDCFLQASDKLREITVVPARSAGDGSVSLESELVSQQPPTPSGPATLTERTLRLLELEREKYHVLAELSGEITFDYDVSTDVLQFSEKFVSVFNESFRMMHARETLCNSTMIYEADKKIIEEKLAQLTPADNVRKFELRIKTNTGEYEWFEIWINGIYMADESDSCSNLIGKLTNVNETKLENARLRRRAETDPLTGLYNRSAVKRMAEGEVGAVFFIDVDDFKGINDRFGHANGDRVLQQIGSGLKAMFRHDDLVGRIGGDEFAVFLHGQNDRSLLERKAQDICRMFQEVRIPEVRAASVSGSVGIALCPEDGADYDAAIDCADQALYSAKNAGKNRYAFYDRNAKTAGFRTVLSEPDSDKRE